MTDKPDLMTENDLSPEAIAHHSFFTRQEKLERLGDMKRELQKSAEEGSASLEDVETRAASIESAIAQVKGQEAGYDGANAMGRTSSSA